MLSVPSVCEGTVVVTVSTEIGFSYRIRNPKRGSGTLVPPRTLSVLLLADGVRTLAEIYDRLRAEGVRLPDPSSLIRIFGMFEASGVIDVAHRFETVEPLRHDCDCCGRSCEGHLVGPIEPEESVQLQERLVELRRNSENGAHGPADGDAVVEIEFEGETKSVLNFPDGVCIFLDEKKTCRLHARWGPLAKPLPCRMFPFRMVRTETGTRTVISPRCFRWHDHRETGTEHDPQSLLKEWGVWRPPALTQGLDSENSERLGLDPSTPAQKANWDDELSVLQVLDDAPSFEGLLAWLSPEEGVTAEQSQHFCRSAFAVGAALFAERFQFEEQRNSSGFAQSVSELAAEASSRVYQSTTESMLDDSHWEYTSSALRNLVYSREVMVFGSVRRGVLFFCVGAVLAHRAAADKPLGVFVSHLTSWLRITSATEVQRVVFPSQEPIDALLSTLAPN